MADYTLFEVDYALDDNDAQDDVWIHSPSYQPFSDLTSLATGTSGLKSYTQEHNFMVLDGSVDEDMGTFGFFSSSKSQSDGTFVSNPTLIAEFDEQHTSYMITFTFVEDSPTEAIITWYLGGVVVYAMTQQWDGNEQICKVQHAIEAYDKITVEFTRALPDRYIKLTHLEFGTTMYWDETIVKSATLVKGCNRLSDMLSIDTLTFELVDTSKKMNFANPDGIHVLFKRNQAMYPREILKWDDGREVVIPLGKFYLNTFSTEGNVGKMNAYSFMGILDNIQYPGSQYFPNGAASFIIEDIFSWAGLDSSDYTISSEIWIAGVSGFVKPQTCKEALKEVLFAVGATIDTSDPDKIKVYKHSNVITTGVDRHNKISTKVSTSEVVTGVKINYSTYVSEETSETIFEDTYNIGTYTVEFKDKYNSFVVTNANVLHFSASSITFEVVGDDMTVTVTGKKLVETQKSITVKRELESGEVENVKEYTTTLCNDEQAVSLANSILDYYKKVNLTLQVQHYADDINMDGMRYVENPNQELDGFVSMFNQRTFDLTGGFVDSATMVGYYDTSNRYYFAKEGTSPQVYELYAGEEIGIT